jgi:hypothetical protein
MIRRILRRTLTRGYGHDRLSRMATALFPRLQMLTITIPADNTQAQVLIETADGLRLQGGIEEVQNILDYVESAHKTLAVVDFWGALLPARVVKEDLGDYIEDIHRRINDGQRFRVWLRVAAAVFWTALNAFGYAMKLLGKKEAG